MQFLDSNRGPLVSEAIALPTGPQTLPKLLPFFVCFSEFCETDFINHEDDDLKRAARWCRTAAIILNDKEEEEELKQAPPLRPLETVWPDWAIYWTLGKFLKPLATTNLPKSPTVLSNFWKGVKIYHFWATFIDIWRFFSGHIG